MYIQIDGYTFWSVIVSKVILEYNFFHQNPNIQIEILETESPISFKMRIEIMPKKKEIQGILVWEIFVRSTLNHDMYK